MTYEMTVQSIWGREKKKTESWVTCNHSNTEYQVVSRCNLIGLKFNQCSFTLPNTCGAFWRRCYRLHNPFCGPTPAAETGESEKKKKKKKKCSQDTHGPYHTPLNATRNVASIVKRSHEPPALSALTITALITPSRGGDTKGRKRMQKRTKTNTEKMESQPFV